MHTKCYSTGHSVGAEGVIPSIWAFTIQGLSLGRRSPNNIFFHLFHSFTGAAGPPVASSDISVSPGAAGPPGATTDLLILVPARRGRRVPILIFHFIPTRLGYIFGLLPFFLRRHALVLVSAPNGSLYPFRFSCVGTLSYWYLLPMRLYTLSYVFLASVRFSY